MDNVRIRRFAPADCQWLVARHQDLYALEEGYDSSFGPAMAAVLQRYCESHDPGCERGWIAVAGERRIGSVFCIRQDEETARLRLFLLTPEARGKGLGKRLLRDCMQFARQAGYREMRLVTHEKREKTGSLYEAFGWRQAAARPVTAYGADLIEQTWHVML